MHVKIPRVSVISIFSTLHLHLKSTFSKSKKQQTYYKVIRIVDKLTSMLSQFNNV